MSDLLKTDQLLFGFFLLPLPSGVFFEFLRHHPQLLVHEVVDCAFFVGSVCAALPCFGACEDFDSFVDGFY